MVRVGGTPHIIQPGAFLHLYVLACEDSEEYKRSIRKRIKDWATVVSDRRFQEWLIIHVSDTSKSKAKFNLPLNLFSVYDKLKSDFNTGKRDR